MRGFKDNLPPVSYKFNKIKKVFEKFSERFCVDLVELPLVEESQLYFRTSGEESEVCNKELFEVRKFKGDFEGWALRPEGTASCVRAVKESSFLNERRVARLGYYGPMFRYNRPQKGRYRQFFQAGWEWLGSSNKINDYEIILAASKILDDLSIEYTLEINSIGNFEDRTNYRNILRKRLNIESDPFKVVDKMDDFSNIPTMNVNDEDKEVFNFISSKLRSKKINFKHNPFLVRGLDYYNGIVFEFKSKKSGQTILAGGRYDGLMKQIGGCDTPAIGFAIGVDRIVDIIPEEQDANKVAILSLNQDDYALSLIDSLHNKGVNCQAYWGYDLKKGLKVISKFFDNVIIVGENEVKENKFLLRNLKNSEQCSYNLDNLLLFLLNK